MKSLFVFFCQPLQMLIKALVILLMVICCFSLTLSAQNDAVSAKADKLLEAIRKDAPAKIDSLNKLIATTQSEIEKGRLLCELCSQFSLIEDYENAQKKGEEGLALCRKEMDVDGISMCLRNMGFVHLGQGNFTEAKKYADLSMEFDMSRLLIENPNKLLEICQKEQKKAQENLNYRSSGSLLSSMGQIYAFVGKRSNAKECYQKALEHYNLSLKDAERLGDKNEIADCLYGIGRVYEIQGKKSKAEEYYAKSRAIKK